MNHTRTNFPPPLLPVVERAVRMALAAREEAAETRFDVWRQRVGNAWSNDGASPIIECALDAALAVMSADRANIQLLEQDVGLVIKGQRGFSKAFLDYFAVVNDGNTACRAAWKKRRLVIVPDITTSRIFSRPVLEVLLDDGIRAVDSVPLLAESGRMVGVLSVHYCRQQSPRDTDLARFERLASFIANSVDNLHPS